MLSQIYSYFTLDTIYLWLNYGVIPIWLALIFFPSSKLNEIFITSIFLPLVFAVTYIYVAYQLISLGENILDAFILYLGLGDLYELFSNQNFLLLFWIHFLSINLFLGSWVSRDSIKYNVPRFLLAVSLITIYFTGPLGVIFYWFIRIFFAKKISIYD